MEENKNEAVEENKDEVETPEEEVPTEAPMAGEVEEDKE